MSSNLVYLTPPENDFEEAYLAARSKEDRLYPDEVVQDLPYLPSDHAQAKEWGLRQQNVEELIRYLHEKQPQRILDLGCGNGWLTHQLKAPKSKQEVLGVDINARELLQAQRLFANQQCHFAYGDIFEADLADKSFEAIVVASCAQYFPSLPDLLNRLLELLRPGGEIHLFDSPIYHNKTVPQARKRTDQYYQQQGVPAMQAHYHHHSWEELQAFNYELIYQPSQLINRIKRKLGYQLSPFPWLIIRHQPTS